MMNYCGMRNAECGLKNTRQLTVVPIRNPQFEIRNRRRGQSMIEYLMLLTIIIAALLSAQRFLKASLMGHWKAIADQYGSGRQYEPGRTVVSQ